MLRVTFDQVTADLSHEINRNGFERPRHQHLRHRYRISYLVDKYVLFKKELVKIPDFSLYFFIPGTRQCFELFFGVQCAFCLLYKKIDKIVFVSFVATVQE